MEIVLLRSVLSRLTSEFPPNSRHTYILVSPTNAQRLYCIGRAYRLTGSLTIPKPYLNPTKTLPKPYLMTFRNRRNSDPRHSAGSEGSGGSEGSSTPGPYQTSPERLRDFHHSPGRPPEGNTALCKFPRICLSCFLGRCAEPLSSTQI